MDFAVQGFSFASLSTKAERLIHDSRPVTNPDRRVLERTPVMLFRHEQGFRPTGRFSTILVFASSGIPEVTYLHDSWCATCEGAVTGAFFPCVNPRRANADNRSVNLALIFRCRAARPDKVSSDDAANSRRASRFGSLTTGNEQAQGDYSKHFRLPKSHLPTGQRS